MKRFLIFLLCLVPCISQAAQLANCDKKPFAVTVINGGQKRVVTLAPTSGSIEELGPVVSFQIEGQPPVVVREPHEQYCIWSGEIKIQRRDPYNDGGHGGFHLR
jgi:hypothetical protein